MKCFKLPSFRPQIYVIKNKQSELRRGIRTKVTSSDPSLYDVVAGIGLSGGHYLATDVKTPHHNPAPEPPRTAI